MWKEDVLCTLYSAPYVRGGCNLYSVLCSLCERRMYPVLCTLYLLWEEGVLPVITATTTTSSTAHHQLWTSHHRAAVWNIFCKSIDERLFKLGRTEKGIQYTGCCNLKPSKYKKKGELFHTFSWGVDGVGLFIHFSTLSPSLTPGALPDQILIAGVSILIELYPSKDLDFTEGPRVRVQDTVNFRSVNPDVKGSLANNND